MLNTLPLTAPFFGTKDQQTSEGVCRRYCWLLPLPLSSLLFFECVAIIKICAGWPNSKKFYFWSKRNKIRNASSIFKILSQVTIKSTCIRKSELTTTKTQNSRRNSSKLGNLIHWSINICSFCAYNNNNSQVSEGIEWQNEKKSKFLLLLLFDSHTLSTYCKALATVTIHTNIHYNAPLRMMYPVAPMTLSHMWLCRARSHAAAAGNTYTCSSHIHSLA